MRKTGNRVVFGLGCLMLASCSAGSDTDNAGKGDNADEQCRAPASASAALDAEFADALNDIGGENLEALRTNEQVPEECGSEKQDFALFRSPCKYLKPFIDSTNDLLAEGIELADQELFQMGYIFGLEGSAVLGPGTAFVGYDVVVDLYHHQLTSSMYKGAGITGPGAKVGGQVFAGFALGFETGVSDWFGYFVNVAKGFDLANLTPLGMVVDLGLTVTTYGSAVDRNEDGFIEPSEFLVPPEGVYGVNIGLSGAVGGQLKDIPVIGPLIDKLPLISPPVDVSEAYWVPNKPVIRWIYDYLQDGFFPVTARLIDPADGSECPESWPDEGGDQDCVVEFGDPDATDFRRSLSTARAICQLNGGCALPASWLAVTAALGINALRTSGLSLPDFCGDEAE